MTHASRLKAFTAATLVSLLAFASPAVRADEPTPDEETFTTLTRRPTPLSDTPANVTIITEQQIKDSGAKSLDELLDKTVSVDMNRTGSVGTFSVMRLRGVPSSAQIKIVIDDQPYGGFAADQNIDISQIQLDNVEKIEIVRGGSSVLYGANTTGGVIHIFTKKRPTDELEGGAGFEQRSFDTRISRANVGAESNGIYANASVNTLVTDGFQRNSDVNSINHALAAGYLFPNTARLGFQFAHTDSDSGVSQGTAIPISEWNGDRERIPANPTKRQQHKRYESRVTFDAPISSSWRAQTLFFGSDDNSVSEHSIDPFETTFDQTSHVLGIDARLLNESGFTAGFSFERDESRNTSYTEKAVSMAGGYLQQELKTAKVSLIPAVRYDHNTNFGHVWNPRLTAIFRVTPVWTMSSNAARSYRAPSFFDQYFDSNFFTPYRSNRNIQPETSWTYDFGNQWHPSPKFDMKVVGFYTTIHNRIVGIDTNGDTVNDTNGNASKAELVGVEFEERAVWGPLTKWENYTYQRSRGFNANQTGSTVYSDIPLTPQHKFNIGLDLAGPAQTSLSNVLQYVAHQYTGAARTGTRLPAYAVWNARLTKKFKIGEMFAACNNLLNRRYAESTDFDPTLFVTSINPMPDRNYAVGLSLRFAQAAN